MVTIFRTMATAKRPILVAVENFFDTRHKHHTPKVTTVTGKATQSGRDTRGGRTFGKNHLIRGVKKFELKPQGPPILDQNPIVAVNLEDPKRPHA